MLNVEIFESSARNYGNYMSNSFVHISVNSRLILSAIKTSKFVMGDDDAEAIMPSYYENTYDILDDNGDVIYTTTNLTTVQEFAIHIALTGAKPKHVAKFFDRRSGFYAQIQIENGTQAFVNSDRPFAIIKATGAWGTIVKRNRQKITLAIHDNERVIVECAKKELAIA